MTSVVQPDLIPQPWSQSGSHATIPDTTSEFGRASWALGFPPETALPLNAGGIPPNWLDFQGVLYALSQHAIFGQAGGRYAWAPNTDYPAGACIIGSNGVVYQALQESGPGTSAGAKNPITAGNTAYWGALATPDGQTIKVVNGKLTADTVTLAAALADGTSITASNGKLSAPGGGGGASALADNVTTVATNNGKLAVDLTNVTSAARKNITPNIIMFGGGLSADASTGRLFLETETVDPADMYTFTFQIVPTFSGDPGPTETFQCELPFDPSSVSQTTIDRYGALTALLQKKLTKVSAVAFSDDISIKLLNTSVEHATPYWSITKSGVNNDILEYSATAPMAWWQEVTWTNSANIIPWLYAILTPFPPINFGSTTTADLSSFFAGCTKLKYLSNNLFSKVAQGKYTGINLQDCFDGCTALANIPAHTLTGLWQMTGVTDLSGIFSDFTVSWPMTIDIDATGVNSATSMFAGQSGSGAVTFRVPSGSTTYTTLSTAYSGTSWITVTGV